ncbi:unnamed protein product [Rotaria sordida]|uniref:Uncharacterized protein n=1 Tax=Rotaria sordida TaxID=392033 RepID=A0A815A2G2_9BILA|nr:unnamed protein product [Rotaria sordida]CAF1251672.1 unnamed protein product [Rotaria sordida]CAF1464732.1 unnamed protein product [Rotaria sordida]CAF3874098.1 unnamed protein product [Rotaria sordida]
MRDEIENVQSSLEKILKDTRQMIRSRYTLPMRNSQSYGPRMNPQSYINQQMTNDYTQSFYRSQAFPENPYMPPSNGTIPNYPHLIPSYGFQSTYPTGNTSLSLGSTVYQQQFFQSYSILANYPGPQGLPQLSPYAIPNLQQLTQPTQQLQTHQSTVPISQLAIPQANPYAQPVFPEKRKKTPLTIVDPVSHKKVEGSTKQSTYTSTTTAIASELSPHVPPETCSTESTTTDSIILNSKLTIDKSKTQSQVDFRRQIADSSNVQTDNFYGDSIHEEINSNQSESESILLDCVTKPTTTIINHDKSQATPKQRLRYDRHEVFRIRDSSGPFAIPLNLPDLNIVLSRRDNNNPHYSYRNQRSNTRPVFLPRLAHSSY